MIRRLLAVCLALGCWLPAARAQKGNPKEVEVETDKSAAADLYVKRRPPTPEAPRLPKEIEARLQVAEKAADGKRSEAIRLLRQFLASNPTGDGKAEGLFKLAELLWEDSRRSYIKQMDVWERKVEACRERGGGCKPPREPEMSLSEPEKLYKTILADHPSYNRRDLVLYLVGFAAREDERTEEALGYFQKLISEHPRSPLYGDAWMMIGENSFALGQWERARDAYAHVLERPEASAFDLALFKSAWCDWKLGQTDRAAKRFKKVLDLAAEADRSGTERERKRRGQLRDEALEYLVVVFSEDEKVGPKDVYDFLASIGGERYSEAILVRLADVFFNQAAYDRAIATNRFLIELEPMRLAAAKYQRRIVDAQLADLQGDKALIEMKVLVEKYGPGSAWVKANRPSQPRAVRRTVDSIEELVRGTAKRFHAEAQGREKARRAPDIPLYQRASDSYAYYLEHFAKHPKAVEARFLHAEILFFKLGKNEEAGDEYMAVGKTAPIGPYHKDAIFKAMAAYKKARPPGARTAGRALLPVDKKFAEAIDLYATLFPADKAIVGVIFENGQLFYDYGDYDEAIKRFGLIVTKYPDDPNAGAAGDRILDALNKAQDYENIEDWARKLRKAKSFQGKDQQARLDRLIVESIMKSGEKNGAAGKHEVAARFYLRIAKEFPGHALAPKATFNAAVMLEKAKMPEEAAQAYMTVANKYQGKSDLAEKSAFTAAQVYESVAYFDRAAEAYEIAAEKYPNGPHGADALFNAGVLRQALGQQKKAIKHYEAYAKRYRKTKRDAEEVAFRVGVVREESGDEGRAEKAFDDYLKQYPRGSHAVEALTRAGRCAFKLGQLGRAERRFGDAVNTWKRASGSEKKAQVGSAAEARYHQGELIYRKYARVSLDVKPRALDKALKSKMKMLDEASVVYLDVVNYGDPQWATAALYRIGAVMEEFAKSLRQAPVPGGLSAQEKTLYREYLDNEVVNVDEKAIELYTVGYQKAINLKVYNRYTKKLREALGRMSASKFPPNKEARESVRLGDRAPELPVVKEVVREK
ncbi:MAG TPA: tetratricopeptide repeat protein [Kofleriaceae bacterium]